MLTDVRRNKNAHYERREASQSSLTAMCDLHGKIQHCISHRIGQAVYQEAVGEYMIMTAKVEGDLENCGTGVRQHSRYYFTMRP